MSICFDIFMKKLFMSICMSIFRQRYLKKNRNETIFTTHGVFKELKTYLNIVMFALKLNFVCYGQLQLYESQMYIRRVAEKLRTKVLTYNTHGNKTFTPYQWSTTTMTTYICRQSCVCGRQGRGDIHTSATISVFIIPISDWSNNSGIPK